MERCLPFYCDLDCTTFGQVLTVWALFATGLPAANMVTKYQMLLFAYSAIIKIDSNNPNGITSNHCKNILLRQFENRVREIHDTERDKLMFQKFSLFGFSSEHHSFKNYNII